MRPLHDHCVRHCRPCHQCGGIAQVQRHPSAGWVDDIHLFLWGHVLCAVFRPKKTVSQSDEEIEQGTCIRKIAAQKRPIWQFGHTLLGVILLILGMYNTNTGPQLYGDMAFLSAEGYLRAWWGWHVVLLSLALCVKIHYLYATHKEDLRRFSFSTIFLGRRIRKIKEPHNEEQVYNEDVYVEEHYEDGGDYSDGSDPAWGDDNGRYDENDEYIGDGQYDENGEYIDNEQYNNEQYSRI
mmetsp:Transcript_16663/g.36275  ORF Transcript_16663/g.36275 Transcript_16663/m.36275 type:complete len:238 (-) Transcript_16663:213-926(-)